LSRAVAPSIQKIAAAAAAVVRAKRWVGRARMRIDRASSEVAPAGREVARPDVKADRRSAKVGASMGQAMRGESGTIKHPHGP
jgi:hypothetical protein